MNTVCLLIHGLGGTAFDLEWVAKALSAAGIATQRVTLPGHGSTVEAYGAARFAHCAAHVEHAYAALAAQGKSGGWRRHLCRYTLLRLKKKESTNICV